MDNSMSPPVKTEKVTMSFSEAILHIVDGRRVHKLEWVGENQETYGFLKNGVLSISIKGQVHDWTLNDGDLSGQDYVILPDLD